MKDSKLKIILPIILIPVLIIVSIIGYRIYQYRQNFKSEIPTEKVLEYLQEKYAGDFENVKLIQKGATKKRPIHNGCANIRKETMLYNEFNFYYSAYSKKYDTEYVVAFANQLPISGFSERKQDYVEDNLEQTVNSNKIINDVCKKLGNSKVEKEYSYTYDTPTVYIKYCIVVNDNFNEEYHNRLIELKEELKKYKDTRSLTKYTHCCYYIKFNDVYLKYSIIGDLGAIYDVVTDSETKDINIKTDEIWNYVGK